jgi:hypothetical protein
MSPWLAWLVRLASGSSDPVHIRTSHDREPEYEYEHKKSGRSITFLQLQILSFVSIDI